MPSLSHKQTELCICGNVVLYINSASYIAEMVLQCAWGGGGGGGGGGHAIQMNDIPKDIKKLSNEDCLFIFTNVTLVWGPKNVVI